MHGHMTVMCATNRSGSTWAVDISFEMLQSTLVSFSDVLIFVTADQVTGCNDLVNPEFIFMILFSQSRQSTFLVPSLDHDRLL
jgi:hypothetical protein